MRNAVKKIIACVLSLLVFISPAASLNAGAAGQGSTGSVLPKVTLQKKAEINLVNIMKYDKSGKTTAAVLKIVQKYYSMVKPKIEPALRSDFAKNSVGEPRFDGKLEDHKSAVSMSSISATALLSKDAVNYAVALSCAAFSKGPKLNLTAQNLAASVYMLYKAKNAKFNAASKENAKYMADIVTVYQYAVSLNPKNAETLVNFGNTFMDMDRQEDAKILYQAALKLEKNYKPAKEGMAAYYLARGDKERAKKELDNGNMMFLSAKVMRDGVKKLTSSTTAPDTKESDSAEKSEAAIAALSKLPLASTADFIKEIDPIDAQQIRLKINNLPQNDKLTLPKLTSIAQVSQYKVYVNDTERFADMELATNDFFDKWNSELDKLAQKAFNEASGMTDKDLNSIYEIRGNQDNPMMEYMFWYNTTVLNKKTSAYFNYFSKTLSPKIDLISTRNEAAIKAIQGLREQEAEKTEQIENSSASDEVKGASIKKIQIEYALQRNEKRQSCFQDNFSMALQLYTKMKPMIEKYWADCMPNVRLLPKGPIRDMGYVGIARTSFGIAQQVIQMVLDGADVDGIYEDVEGQDLVNAGEELREVYRQQAEQEYKQTNAPAAFSSQALLDKFSLSRSWGPIEVKITQDSIEINGAALVAGKIGMNWKEGTFSGGFGVGVRGELSGTVGVKGEAVTMITYTVDLNSGKVTDLDWKANAGVSVSAEAGGKMEAGISYEASVMQGSKFSAGINEAYGDVNFEAIKN